VCDAPVASSPVNRIGDYGLIGDCHSLALVGRDGSIDWACFPRFDSPSVFARMLDPLRGGHFLVGPDAGPHALASFTPVRHYAGDTNVLVTVFTSASGDVLEVTDCMPVSPFDPDRRAHVESRRSILRRARCVAGQVAVRVELAARFEYATVVPRFTVTDPGRAEIVGGPDAFWVRTSHPLHDEGEAVGARWALAAGEEAWVEAAWTSAHDEIPADDQPGVPAMQRRLDETLGFWRAWIDQCAYRGLRADDVRRSALVLKALTYSPTGAVVAAGTTSLPEWVGGERNWDYRYTWVRDATLTLASLGVLGFDAEAAAFKRWLERTGAGRPSDLQIMYGICGERLLPELELSHLDGHRRSRPVRVGNGAARQLQLDSFGQLLEAAWLFTKVDGDLTESNWAFLAGLADLTASEWRRPDHGIWEVRDRPRHFVHSKLNCWVALDRAVRLATEQDLPGNLELWARERDEVREYLLEEAAPHGWFRQAVGEDAPDAATLLIPALGFLPATHPLVRQTVEVVERDLTEDGLVRRYLNPDGLEGQEGAFLLCSFWLIDCYTYAGRLDEAEALLDRMAGFANDVGLFAEEVDLRTGEPLGNVPQAFTHMALVASCAHLSAARAGLVTADEAVDFSEAALDRLVASRGGRDGRPREVKP